MNLAGKKAPSRTLTEAVTSLSVAGRLAAAATIATGATMLAASLAMVGCGSEGPAKSTGLGGQTTIGGAGGGPSGGNGFPPAPIDLCDGLVQDKDPHPMTTLAKPAVGAAVTEPQFGTQIRRITGVAAGSDTPALVPLYSTVSAWNADESRLLLLNIPAARHELWDGKSYTFIRSLEEINPPDVEQVFWHTTDPDVFLYVEGKDFIRYHVTDARKEKVTTFSMCSGGNPTGGDDPMFSAFDSNRFAFHCGSIAFTYDLASNSVLGMKTISEAIQMSPSGTFTYGSKSGTITDASLNVVRVLDLADPAEHASLGRWPTGEDTWNGLVYDPGPMGDQAIGSVVVSDITHFVSKVVVGPDTGFPVTRATDTSRRSPTDSRGGSSSRPTATPPARACSTRRTSSPTPSAGRCAARDATAAGARATPTSATRTGRRHTPSRARAARAPVRQRLGQRHDDRQLRGGAADLPPVVAGAAWQRAAGQRSAVSADRSS